MKPYIITITLLILGIGLIISSIILALKIPNPTKTQFFVFRVVLALGGACIGAIIPGFIEFEGDIQELTFRAGGAMALLIVFYWFNPPELVRSLK